MKSLVTGFRKLLMGIVFLMVAVVLLILDYIPQDNWLEHVSAVVIAFMGTNLGEHIIKIGQTWMNQKKNSSNS